MFYVDFCIIHIKSLVSQYGYSLKYFIKMGVCSLLRDGREASVSLCLEDYQLQKWLYIKPGEDKENKKITIKIVFVILLKTKM